MAKKTTASTDQPKLGAVAKLAALTAALVPEPAPAAAATKKKAATKKAATKKAATKKAKKAGAVANAIVDEDTAFGSLFATVAKTDVGDGLVTTEQSEKMIVGLSLPGLAPRFLFQQDVITLGRNIMLVGLPGSCKSALLAEFYRWVLLHKGMAGHIETENKDSPDLRNSIFWYDRRLMRRMYYQPANSQEAWMDALTAWLVGAEAKFAKIRRKKRAKPKKGELAAEFKERTAAKVIAGNPGWIYPLIFGIDSLTAVSSDESQDKVKKTGHTERMWPVEAGNLSNYAKSLPDMLRGKPIILASTNHLKPGQDGNGMPVDNVPGGKAMRFMNTVELKMIKLGGVKTAEFEANRIQIVNLKNSLGTTGLKINVDMKWWWEVDEETGEPIQRTLWDWDTASIDCLVAQKTRLSAGQWKVLNEVVDIHVSDSGPRTFWSKELGIPSSAPVRFDEAGKILESRQDVLDAIYPILHIKHRTRFVPGVDYTDLQELLRRSAMAMERVYTPQELSELGQATVALLDEEMAREIEAAEKRKAPQDDDDDEDD